MNYAQQQRDPRRHLIGLASVIIFHLILGYALVNGLARKVVDVIKQPLSVSVIEELKAPPPPPAPKVIPQPRSATPPLPAYIPPVEAPASVVQAPITTSAKLVQEALPVTPAAPVVTPPVNVSVACPNHRSVQIDMPRQAVRQNLSGEVLVAFTVGSAGEVKDIAIVRSTNSIFNNAALQAVAQYRCLGQGKEARVQVPFSFRVEN